MIKVHLDYLSYFFTGICKKANAWNPDVSASICNGGYIIWDLAAILSF